jgi:arylsulfatase A-like enzyme
VSTRPNPSVSELERAFDRGRLSRRQFVVSLLGLGLGASAVAQLARVRIDDVLAATPPAQYLVLIVLDAFRPEYMGLAPMPALTALARSGVAYERAWVGQLETYTPAGHSSISTGCGPHRHGILGFEWRDPQTGKEVLDGWAPAAKLGSIDRDLRAANVPSLAQVVKAADPSARVVAVSSEKTYAAEALGGWAADYVLYYDRPSGGTTLLPRSLVGHVPAEEVVGDPKLRQSWPLKHFTDWDYLSGRLALAAARAYRPRLLLVNMPGPDFYGHPYGGLATPAVMKQVVAGVDRNIGRIVSAYKAAGIFDQTVFMVTADHGMVPNNRAVDGNLTKKTVRGAGGNYYFHYGGTAAYIYLHNQDHALPVSAAMARVPNVAAAYHRTPSNGQFGYDLPSGVRLDGALDAAYRFLMGTFAGATSPDVVVPFREDTIGRIYPNAHGDHGGLNWGAPHVPLIISGPGVRSGTTSQYPARLIDVAPTALRLLGLPQAGMDGTVLADALTDAQPGELGAQSAMANALTGYQNGLLAQTEQNTTEDGRTGHRPPRSLPPRP